MPWDWGDLEQTAFVKAKQLMAQVQALTVITNGNPSKMDITVETTGYAWGLWQRQDDTEMPLEF
jgi:hypothetical protein